MAVNWIELVGAGLSGGFAVKALDYIYQEYIRRSKAKKSARSLVDTHIDPILKSADELVGKTRSLAQSDFKELIKNPPPEGNEFEEWIQYLEFMYLFAQFWSRIQILRIEGVFVNLSTDNRGKKLIQFFSALESTRTRLIGRSWQRAIGETLLDRSEKGHSTLSYIDYTKRFLSDNDFRRWYKPLIDVLLKLNHSRERQRLLTYGAVIHSLIDTLDSDHLVTRYRPGWPNKLTKKSQRGLKFRIFRLYLPFVENPNKYLIPGYKEPFR
jgi:hypothetical protein